MNVDIEALFPFNDYSTTDQYFPILMFFKMAHMEPISMIAHGFGGYLPIIPVKIWFLPWS